MSANIDFKKQLIATFKAAEERMNGEAKTPLHQQRQAALSTFEALGFPTIKHEEWKYSNVKNLVSQAFNLNAPFTVSEAELNELEIPNLEGNLLYFVNGVYHPEISVIESPETELKIANFSDAYKQFPELINQHFAQYAEYSNNAFTALNTAFASDGVFIHVPAGQTVRKPIILRFIGDARTENVASQPRNLILVGKNAEVKVAESFRTLGENAAFTNIVTEIFQEEDSRFEYYKVQNESDKSYHIGSTHIEQKDRAYSHCITVSLNGGFVRNNLNIRIDGEHCEANMYGVYLPNGKQHIDNHTVVDHAKPNSVSNELYKGILKDKATGVFNGKIFVREDAQKTNAFQSCKNVLASGDATMNTKPQLEIWADDVKCSHGTTTGQLDEEALFYLQSRGLPKDVARNLLMFAFAEDVVEKMRIPAIKEYLEGLIEEKIAK